MDVKHRLNIYLFCENKTIVKCWSTHGKTAPLASEAGEALDRPAGLLADGALGVGRKVALAPVMPVVNHRQLFTRHVGGVLFAIRHRKVLTLSVNEVLAD
jgi:hypothetical protein